MKTNITLETLEFSVEELQKAIEMYLISTGELDDNETLLSIDIPLEVTTDGLFAIDVEIGETV